MMFKLLSKTIIASLFVVTFIEAQTIVFKGLEYKVVKSKVTNNEWLDRNLGAKKACSSYVDTQCFGDYYQWGRSADGHERANSKVIKKYAQTTNKNNAFISVKEGEVFDWSKQSDDKLWTKNNICPKGFRVPTISELSQETEKNNNFLKLSLSGYKSFCNGKLTQTKRQGGLWSSSAYEKDAYYLDIRNNLLETSTSSRADAFPVRCIKQK